MGDAKSDDVKKKGRGIMVVRWRCHLEVKEKETENVMKGQTLHQINTDNDKQKNLHIAFNHRGVYKKLAVNISRNEVA